MYSLTIDNGRHKTAGPNKEGVLEGGSQERTGGGLKEVGGHNIRVREVQREKMTGEIRMSSFNLHIDKTGKISELRRILVNEKLGGDRCIVRAYNRHG